LKSLLNHHGLLLIPANAEKFCEYGEKFSQSGISGVSEDLMGRVKEIGRGRNERLSRMSKVEGLLPKSLERTVKNFW
jgi:hypothetical protein